MSLPESMRWLSSATPMNENLQLAFAQFTISQGILTLALPDRDIAKIAVQPFPDKRRHTWSIDPAFLQTPEPQVTHIVGSRRYELSSGNTKIRLALANAAVSVAQDDAVILQSPETGAFSINADGSLSWHILLEEADAVFGSGQRTGPLNQRGKKRLLWSADAEPDHSERTDPMHQIASWVMIVRNGKTFGIFFDSPWQATLDIGATNPDVLTYTTAGTDITAYVCGGPSPAAALAQYTRITGRPPLFPRWSLGNQQSRWSYMNAAELEEIAARFRAERIPCDALYLDIDYMRGFRDFTWDEQSFPDFQNMLQRLNDTGFHVVTIIDPGIKVDPDFSAFQEGTKYNYFVKNSDGTDFTGWVWPGLSVWTDFSQSAARRWWSNLHKPLLAAGVSGIWDDMNEPSQAGMYAPSEVQLSYGQSLPNDAVCNNDDDPIPFAEFHNAYGLAMTQSTYDAFTMQRPNTRPFVLSRSAASGSQRYAAVWNGDNSSIWEHIGMGITMNIGLGLSGFAFTGFDIGGFNKFAEPEMLVRFTQAGVCMPFCRNHASKFSRKQEPWAFGEPYTSMIRRAIEFRYSLLPLYVSLLKQSHDTGAPLIRPIWWNEPENKELFAVDDEFLIGESILAAPVTKRGAAIRSVVFPAGEWFDLATNEVYIGNSVIEYPVTLDTLPIFIKAGSIIPFAPAIQHTGAIYTEPLEFRIFISDAAPQAQLQLWDDTDAADISVPETYAEYTIEAQAVSGAAAVAMQQTRGLMNLRYPGVHYKVVRPGKAGAYSEIKQMQLQRQEFMVVSE